MIPKYEIEKPIRDEDGKVKVVDEGESCRIEGILTLKDQTFALAAIQSFMLTLYNESTLQIINNRENQDIINANGGTIDAEGNFIVRLRPLDNVIVGLGILRNETEKHVAKLHGTYISDGETETFIDEWVIYVRKLAVPVSS